MKKSYLTETEEQFHILELAFKKQITDFAFYTKEAMFCNFSCAVRAQNEALLERITGSVIFPGLRLCVTFLPRGDRTLTGLLHCCIRFGPRADAPSYTLYQLLPYLDPDDFSCYTLSSIVTEAQLCAAMQYLFSAFLRYLPDLQRIARQPETQAALDQTFRQDVITYFQDDVFTRYATLPKQLERMLQRYEQASHLRFCSRSYSLFLLGDCTAARRSYRSCARHGRLSSYEQRLYAFLQTLPAARATNCGLPRTLWFFLPDTDAEKEQLHRSQTKALAAGWALCYLLLSALTLTAFSVFCSLFSQSHLLVLFPSRTGLLVVALLPSILLTFVSRHLFYHWFAPKQETAMLDQDAPPSRPQARQWISRAVIAFCLFFTLFYANCNMQFDSSGLSDKRALGSLRGTFTPYSQVSLAEYDSQYVLYDIGGSPCVLNHLTSTEVIESQILPLLGESTANALS